MHLTSTSLPRSPDFFIVGAAKAGTTSLFHYLAQHPDLYLPTSDKEPGFFCNLWGTDDPDYYGGLFSPAETTQLLGEASTPYLTCPKSPGLLFEANPKARILIMLRNPATRAFSLYKQMVKVGHERIAPFSKALAMEVDRLLESEEEQQSVPGYYYNYLYLRSGFYDEQLVRYYDTFPADHIRVILFEDFIVNPGREVQGILRFLGVSPHLEFFPEVFNPAQYPRSLALQHFLKRRVEAPARAARRHKGIILANWLKRINLALGRPPRLSAPEYNELVAAFTPSIRRTAELLNLNLDHWLEQR